MPDLRPPVAVRWLVLGLVIVLPLGAGFGLRSLRVRPWRVRVGGVAAVLGGALWTWMWVWGSQSTTNDPTWIGLGAGLLLALAVMGLAGAQRPTRFGWLGLVLAGLGPLAVAAGLLLSSWFQWDAGWLGLIIGLLSHVIGLTLIGLANLLAQRRSFLSLWPLAMGVLGGLLPVALSFANNSNADWPALIMAYGLGGGWVLLGLALWRTAPAAPPPA